MGGPEWGAERAQREHTCTERRRTTRPSPLAWRGGAALDAQPNGYDMMNYTGMRQSAALYSKVRGYALQPLEPIDERSPELGPQSNLCREGSNCFNLTAFRFDLSAALHGHAQPNEIRRW